LEHHLLLAHDLGFLDDLAWEELSGGVCEVKQMLSALIKKVRPAKN
jgi:hypothetical protein